MRKRKCEKLNTIPQGKGLTIAIDIDGTIADSRGINFSKADNDPHEIMKSKPIPAALRTIKRLYRAGHKIVFYTSRRECLRKATLQWLRKHGFPHHYLEMRKFVAHVYIDDRAIRARDWKHIAKELKDPTLPGRRARKKGRL